MRRRRVLRHVAVWAGLIVVGSGAWLQWNRYRSGRSMNKAVAFIEISTGYQQVRKVILPDSSASAGRIPGSVASRSVFAIRQV